MERPANTAIRTVIFPVTGFAALMKVGIGRLVALFDPPEEIETRVDLVPPDESEPPATGG
jgi:hypothetical protein